MRNKYGLPMLNLFITKSEYGNDVVAAWTKKEAAGLLNQYHCSKGRATSIFECPYEAGDFTRIKQVGAKGVPRVISTATET